MNLPHIQSREQSVSSDLGTQFVTGTISVLRFSTSLFLSILALNIFIRPMTRASSEQH